MTHAEHTASMTVMSDHMTGSLHRHGLDESFFNSDVFWLTCRLLECYQENRLEHGSHTGSMTSTFWGTQGHVHGMSMFCHSIFYSLWIAVAVHSGCDSNAKLGRHVVLILHEDLERKMAQQCSSKDCLGLVSPGWHSCAVCNVWHLLASVEITVLATDW